MTVDRSITVFFFVHYFIERNGFFFDLKNSCYPCIKSNYEITKKNYVSVTLTGNDVCDSSREQKLILNLHSLELNNIHTKINCECTNISQSVPHGSILGPLLFLTLY